MRKLNLLIWEAAIPPTLCALVTLVTYLTQVNQNYWNLAFQAVLGKLYVISLFVSLNGRADLQQQDTSIHPSHLSLNIRSHLNNGRDIVQASHHQDPDAAEHRGASSPSESDLTAADYKV